MKPHRLFFLAALLWNTAACTQSEPSDAIVPDAGKPHAGIVSGRVLNEQGQPVANAEIVASSTDFYNKTSTGHTDAKGNYRIQVPTGVAAGSYSVEGTVTFRYHNKNYKMALYQDDTRVFSAYEGAIRNFTFRLKGKRTADDDASATPLGGTLEVHHQVDRVVWENLELMLEPDGPLVDGSAGQKIVTKMPLNDYRIRDIPVGQYRITARDKATGQALGVMVAGTNQNYATSAVGLFHEADFEGDTRYELMIYVDTL
ncbi:carboxypeptidase-like regulatory domain-containing protein [Salmonirosea aquatica]|uniref:Carboxypeptidase regulatory-like domain-containing protein n=1 Tax=Salmonirosea aquatica TaxID=2654236 RepID=A0A7C9G017_9BACT|nr:hypothetical protein [Cytophagaceae bacterium SJW1-29]